MASYIFVDDDIKIVNLLPENLNKSNNDNIPHQL